MEETGFWLDAEMHISKCNVFVLLIHNTSAHVARGKTGCGHGQLYKIMESTTETFWDIVQDNLTLVMFDNEGGNAATDCIKLYGGFIFFKDLAGREFLLCLFKNKTNILEWNAVKQSNNTSLHESLWDTERIKVNFK